MDIIDFHAHPMYNFHLNTHGVNIDLQRFRDDLISNGITKVCGSVIYSEINNRPIDEYEHIIPTLNEQAIKCREIYGDFYVPGIHVHPDYVDMSCRELEKYSAKGVKLIGELVPYMMRWPKYACRGFIEIMEYARELDMVVNMHPLDPEDMFKLSESLPGLKLVWAHISGYGWFEEELELMRRFDNVYFDISAHGTTHPGTLRYAIDRVGSDRLLFGTDYPGESPAKDIAAVMHEDLTDSERERIFSKNAKYLLGI